MPGDVTAKLLCFLGGAVIFVGVALIVRDVEYTTSNYPAGTNSPTDSTTASFATTNSSTSSPTLDPLTPIVNTHCGDSTGHLGVCSGTVEMCLQTCRNNGECTHVSYAVDSNFGNLYSTCKNKLGHVGRNVYGPVDGFECKVATRIVASAVDQHTNARLRKEYIDGRFKLVEHSLCCQQFTSLCQGEEYLIRSKHNGGALEVHGGYLYFISSMLFIQRFRIDELNGTNIYPEMVHNNLRDVILNPEVTNPASSESIKFALVHEDYLYLSFVESMSPTCKTIHVIRAPMREEARLHFEKYFAPSQCVDWTKQKFNALAAGGKLVALGDEILLSAGDFQAYTYSQNKTSLFGKIVRINSLSTWDVVSMGHRNPQGLTTSRTNPRVIIETEHGPNGGDEINVINVSSTGSIPNYGWPVSSYGEHYSYSHADYGRYGHGKDIADIAPLHPNHTSYGFIEPIANFPLEANRIITGISDVKPNYFSRNESMYLLATLNGLNLCEIMVDETIWGAKILKAHHIGRRIRVMVFAQGRFFLLLENRKSSLFYDDGGGVSLGILTALEEAT